MSAVRFVILCTCLLVYLSSDVGAAVFDSGFEAKLDTFVESTMGCRHVPGLTLGVVKDNTSWAKGYGYADISARKTVSPETLFNIGSVTKSFTMVLLGTLLAERNLTWTTKVRDVLGPEYMFIDSYRTSEATLKDLLSHRTGLAGLDESIFTGIPKEVTREQRAKQLKHLPEWKSFRDSYNYNNYMYMYLGHICEKMGGDTWERLLQTRLLAPLGMTSSRILREPVDVLKDGVAKPYIYNDGRYQNGTLAIYDIHPIEPAGAILSTATDMIKWMKFLLSKGKLHDGTKLLPEHFLSEAFEPTSTMLYSNTSDSYMTHPAWPIELTPVGYGYALIASTYRGYKRVWHSGGLFSYITRMFLYPDRNIGVFVSTNGPATMELASWTTKTVGYFTSDGALGLEPWLNGSTSCTFPEPWLPDDNTPSPSNATQTVIIGNTTDYIGTFYDINQLIVPINIVDTASTTSLNFKIGRVSGVLHSTNKTDVFRMEITEPFELLQVDANNNTLTTKATFGRDDGSVVSRVTVGFDVDVTFNRSIGSNTSGSRWNRSPLQLMVLLYALCVIYVSRIMVL